MRIHKRYLPESNQSEIEIPIPSTPSISKFVDNVVPPETMKFVKIDENYFHYIGDKSHGEVMRILRGRLHYRERMRKWEAFYKRDPSID